MPDREINKSHSAVIGVVGVCGSGKSTLVSALRAHGLELRHIAQEHSYVPTMWERMVSPDVLIFLDCSYPETIRRRNLDWTEREYLEQHHRLRHARANASLYLFTDTMTPQGVSETVLNFLRAKGIQVPPAE